MFVFSVHLLGRLPVQFVLMASFDNLQIRAIIMHVFSCAFYAHYGRCTPSLPLVVVADLSSGTRWVNTLSPLLLFWSHIRAGLFPTSLIPWSLYTSVKRLFGLAQKLCLLHCR